VKKLNLNNWGGSYALGTLTAIERGKIRYSKKRTKSENAQAENRLRAPGETIRRGKTRVQMVERTTRPGGTGEQGTRVCKVV